LLLFAIPYRKLVEKGLIDITSVSKDLERGQQVIEKIPCILWLLPRIPMSFVTIARRKKGELQL